MAPRTYAPRSASTTSDDSKHNDGPGHADAPAPAQTVAPEPYICISAGNDRVDIFFNIRPSTKLKKLMRLFLRDSGPNDGSTAHFYFKGLRVWPTDTPKALDMVKGDSLEVIHRVEVRKG